eukprot:TRINITY_DN415_c0_g2_i4.p1 TRINITY_DN415_c0_g2~~TRINITY_DN415_c0_g2_i4.p1  ORF type:complete len:342 (-),score=60.86 TRINITY_DN415_c0_g2_i4:1130-2155(-)
MAEQILKKARSNTSPAPPVGPYNSVRTFRRPQPHPIFQNFLLERERRFQVHVGSGVKTEIPPYDSLFDSHMRDYFSSPTVRKMLVKNGVVAKSGVVLLSSLDTHKPLPPDNTVLVQPPTVTSRSAPETRKATKPRYPHRREPQPGDPFYRAKLPAPQQNQQTDAPQQETPTEAPQPSAKAPKISSRPNYLSPTRQPAKDNKLGQQDSIEGKKAGMSPKVTKVERNAMKNERAPLPPVKKQTQEPIHSQNQPEPQETGPVDQESKEPTNSKEASCSPTPPPKKDQAGKAPPRQNRTLKKADQNSQDKSPKAGKKQSEKAEDKSKSKTCAVTYWQSLYRYTAS